MRSTSASIRQTRSSNARIAFSHKSTRAKQGPLKLHPLRRRKLKRREQRKRLQPSLLRLLSPKVKQKQRWKRPPKARAKSRFESRQLTLPAKWNQLTPTSQKLLMRQRNLRRRRLITSRDLSNTHR